MKDSKQHYFVCGIQSLWNHLLLFLLAICGTPACVSSASITATPIPSEPSTATVPCVTPTPTSTPSFYPSDEVYLEVGIPEFASGGESNTNQIWCIGLDDASKMPIYQAPKLLSIIGNDMLLPETVQEIRGHFEAYPEAYPSPRFPDIDTLATYVTINHLTLSPNKRLLAWTELYTWCPGNYCYGEARIKAFQMDSGNMVIDRRAKLAVMSLAWAPDNQTLVFSEQFKVLGTFTYTLKLLDSRSGKVRFIGNNISPALSPDGQRLAAVDPSPHRVSGLDLISLDDYSKQALTPPIWSFISTPAWSPDGLHLAFAGRMMADGPRESGTSIYTLNLQTLELVTITENIDILFFDSPRWSPDGNLIAADASEVRFPGWNHLIVLDSQSGEVVSDFVGRRNTSSWEWSDDGQSILFVKGFVPETEKEIAIFHILTGNVTTLAMPDAIRDDYYDGRLSLGDITW